jgi:hypothetical protein
MGSSDVESVYLERNVFVTRNARGDVRGPKSTMRVPAPVRSNWSLAVIPSPRAIQTRARDSPVAGGSTIVPLTRFAEKRHASAQAISRRDFFMAHGRANVAQRIGTQPHQPARGRVANYDSRGAGWCRLQCRVGRDVRSVPPPVPHTSRIGCGQNLQEDMPAEKDRKPSDMTSAQAEYSPIPD